MGKFSRGVKNVVGLLFPSLVVGSLLYQVLGCRRCLPGCSRPRAAQRTGTCHLPVILKGFAVLGSGVGLGGSCQFSFTSTMLLGKLFVSCPFPAKHLWALVVFPLDQFPPLVYQAVTRTVAVVVSLCRCCGSWHCPQKK